jgi:VIT1/CCC1 family predicted Fe2+/Mn2+ transporter
MNIISKDRAIQFSVALLSLVIAFHLTILTQLIPYTIVWAGKLKTVDEMYVFEAISISINLFLIITLLQKGNYIKRRFTDKILNIILWLFLALFIVNSFGNLFAESAF